MPLNEYEFPITKVANVQEQLERLVERNYYLHRAARDAYRSYIQAYADEQNGHNKATARLVFSPTLFFACSYASHALRDTFNVGALDLLMVAKSFGFATPPAVPLAVETAKKLKRRGGGGGLGRGDQKRRRYDESNKSAASRKTKKGAGERQFSR